MTPGEVRACLVTLESMRLISGRPDPDAPRGLPRRVYAVTGEGRRKTGIGDVRAQ